MELEFNIAQQNYFLSIQKKNEDYEIKIDDEIITLTAEQITPNCIMLVHENGNQRIFIASALDKTFVHLNGRQVVVDHPEPTEKTSYQGDEQLLGSETGICAPMPGKILKILVEQNQEVEPKQNLVIVEAMKMEHNIRAPRKGVVKKVNFKEGDLIDTGQEILEIEFDTEYNNG